MDWKVIGASVRGSSHEKTGKPCQDANAWLKIGDAIFIAVADGAGSASFSELGSSIAVAAALDMVESQSFLPSHESEWLVLLKAAMLSARQALTTEASSRGISVRELATTLILTVATPTHVVAVQIGDGAVVVGDARNVMSLTRPQSGEYLNVTNFLTSSDAMEYAETIVWAGATKIAVFSDGLQMLALKMPAGTAHSGFFIPFFNFVAKADERSAATHLKNFLMSSKVRSRTDDDITLVLAHLCQGGQDAGQIG